MTRFRFTDSRIRNRRFKLQINIEYFDRTECGWGLIKFNLCKFMRPISRYSIGVLALFLVLCASGIANAQAGWEIGKIVGLNRGTCIREGPGFQYRAHTRVPENEWAVKVIDGPRIVEGKRWFDTSRRGAGDPSGGTGWVMEDQADTNCEFQRQQPTVASSLPVGRPPIEIKREGLLEEIQVFWNQLPTIAKSIVFVLALLAIPLVWRVFGGAIVGLIGQVIVAGVIWLVMDLSRSVWASTWQRLGSQVFGAGPPDLAILLAAVPLVSWLLALVRSAVAKR